MISDNEEIFVGEFENNSLPQMRINTDGTVAFQNIRRTSQYQQDIIAEEIKKTLKMGAIRYSSSNYASPVVLARKPNGSLRLCIDFRTLNAHTIDDSFVLPRMDDNLSRFHGMRVFIKLDMRSGYWQLMLHPDDCHKTAFSTHLGLYTK